MIAYREVPFGSNEYRLTVDLRLRVLRIPLGLDFTDEQLAAEQADLHLAGFSGERLACCLVLSPVSDAEIRMRQVAVEPDLQKGGVGSGLVRFSEEAASARGYGVMVLHARAPVVPFYRRLGYEVVGPEFEEVGIPHRVMRKRLS